MVDRFKRKNETYAREEGVRVKLGTVKTITSGSGVTVQIDGESAATTKKYTYLSSYTPAVNDRVLIAEVGGSYVILGKIQK